MNDLHFFSVSTVVKGKQMVSVLNAMNITCACYGNHDFGKFFFSNYNNAILIFGEVF